MEEGGGSKEKLHPSITCTDGASGGMGASGFLLFFFVVFFVFVNKTHPAVKSDILAIKTIRFLFVLPIESREFGKDGTKSNQRTTKQNSAVRRVTTPSQN